MSSDDTRLLSEISGYELININDGEKYNYLENNDLVINLGKSKLGLFSSTREFLEIPWECVKKIGSKTIILDADEENIKKTEF